MGVDTAVPAFVGYTEKADIQGRSVTLAPVRVNSLREFDDVFGGESRPPRTKFTFDKDAPRDFEKLQPEGLRLLHYSVGFFYANGGGPCFVVSVGTYEEEVSSAKLKEGIEALQDQVGPTLLVVPDLSLLPITKAADGTPKVDGFKGAAKAMLDQCAKKQDRVALLDVVHARDIDRASLADLPGAIGNFRQDVEHECRNYGVAYFPYLNASIVQAADLDFRWFDHNGIIDFVLHEALKLFPNPQDTVVNAAMEAVRKDLKARTSEGTQEVKNVLEVLDERDKGAARKLRCAYDSFCGLGAVTPAPAVGATAAAPATAPFGPAITDAEVKARDRNLRNAFPGLAPLYAAAAKKLNRLPASAAMAGVMAFIDATRGVWTAPANIGLTAVDSPTLTISDDIQADLHKPLDGKAINVIREFIGRGPVVWGARTLDGNSNDYRYVQVRRTIIYIEQSVKAAMKPFVFAPNDDKTWVSVTGMISNFLQDLWAKGGLMGATAKDAFSVFCGIGATMTAEDVLLGYMVVRVVLVLLHPAEFIELTFKQKMEDAG